MISIAGFIVARLDDDELRLGPYPVYACPAGTVLYTIKQREHRDIDAKRRILVEHTCQCPDPDCRDCGACSGQHHADPTPAPCLTMRLLAMRWDDHEDYQEGWAP